ncbi:MAG: (Fe-S)-binding protein [Campylobacterota bacterium]|nr:(Fe-S)-binding protein [Campylobacterota bacterium]
MVNNKFNYTDISDDCIKCGKCKTVCTIFNVNQDETTSPRGFIDLLGAYKRDELELDKNAKDIFESCFLCTNCVEVCPNDLPTDMIIEQVRSDIAKKYGIAWYKRAFFFLLRNRKIMDFLAKMGWVFQTCGLKINNEKQSGKFRLNFPIEMIKDRTLPFADRKSFLNSYPEQIKYTIPKLELGNESKSKLNNKVAIFIGCMGNYAYTNIGKSLLKILKTLETDVMIPKKQLCCGAPAYFTGDFDTVDYLIKENIVYFESFIDEVDAIIIPEATCSAMINTDWEHYLHDQLDWKKRAVKLSSKIHMATKWLENNTKLKDILSSNGKKMKDIVTYHDPCHAKKMQNVYKEPRKLLNQNYKIEEMSDSNECCGFGGVTMQSEKYHIAKAVGVKKAAMINNTKANIVSAECSACRMQITDSLGRTNSDVIFKNPIELIADAL